MAIGEPAGSIDQDAIKGDAKAAAHRAEPLRLFVRVFDGSQYGNGYQEYRSGYRAFNIGTLKIRLNTKHPSIDLRIVTGLGTANESIAADLIAGSCLRVAARSVQYPHRIDAERLAVIAKPAPAGISADIKPVQLKTGGSGGV